MASEQTNTHAVIALAVAEVMRAAIQTMAAAGNERAQNAGPKLGSPTMKHPNFNWEAEDKYNKLKNVRVEVNNIFRYYNTPQAYQLAIIKNGFAEKVYNS